MAAWPCLIWMADARAREHNPPTNLTGGGRSRTRNSRFVWRCCSPNPIVDYEYHFAKHKLPPASSCCRQNLDKFRSSHLLKILWKCMKALGYKSASPAASKVEPICSWCKGQWHLCALQQKILGTKLRGMGHNYWNIVSCIGPVKISTDGLLQSDPQNFGLQWVSKAMALQCRIVWPNCLGRSDSSRVMVGALASEPMSKMATHERRMNHDLLTYKKNEYKHSTYMQREREIISSYIVHM